MLIVHVHVRVRPGHAADFLAETLVNARASLGEPGVLRFDVIQDNDDPDHVVLVEVYRDADAAAAHKQQPHYATWRDTVAEMMAEPRWLGAGGCAPGRRSWPPRRCWTGALTSSSRRQRACPTRSTRSWCGWPPPRAVNRG